MKKYFGFILSIVLALIMMAFTFYVKSTLKPDDILVNKIKDTPYSYFVSEEDRFSQDLEDFKIDENDIIALKVKLNKHIKFVNKNRISEFDVLESYNSSDFSDEKIYIAEGIMYNENLEVFNILNLNHIPMKEGSEYIVLLDSHYFEDYQNILDKKLYNLYGNNNKSFSKISTNASKFVNDIYIKYDDLDDYLPVQNDKQKEEYLNKVNEIFIKLGIQ